MTVHITQAEAKRLGINVPKTARQRTTRREAPGPNHTICNTCQQEFFTATAEDRHVNETGHARYSVVF